MDASLDIAVEQAVDAIMITDLGGVIQYVNRACERTTGYSRGEIIGKHARLFRSGAHDPAFYRELWETLTRGQVWRGTLVNRRKDGGLSEEAAVISPLRDGAGRVTGYLAVKRDVTRERQQALRQRRRETMTLIRRVSGGVAHDVNNLLMTIVGHAEMLESRLSGVGPASEEVLALKASCDRATAFTRHVLALGQRRVREPAVIDMNEVAPGIEKLLRRVLGDGIQVTVLRSTQPATVLFEPGQLEQIFLQMALRARDAMPSGGTFCVAISHHASLPSEGQPASMASDDADWIEVRVSDTGVGFGADETAAAGALAGSMGLQAWEATYIVGLFKETLRRRGGHLMVSGEPAIGTTFALYLPHVRLNGTAEGEATQTAEDLSGSDTVLLAEDEDGVRELVRVALTRLGYRVLDAPDGVTAMERAVFHGAPIALLITDVVMPGMNGQELADRLVALYPTARVIYMSGYPHEIVGDARRTLFLQKPFTREKLARAVREVFRRK